MQNPQKQCRKKQEKGKWALETVRSNGRIAGKIKLADEKRTGHWVVPTFVQGWAEMTRWPRIEPGSNW